METINPLRTSTYFDSSKILCELHPNQHIVNFCKNQKCLIGLCPSCICIHTEMHLKESTAPIYESIQSVHTQTLEEVNRYLQGLQNEKQKINGLIRQIKNRKKQHEQIFNKAKKSAYKVVDKYLQLIHNQFEINIEKQIKNSNLHSVQNLGFLSQKISKQMRGLLQDSQQLASMKKFVGAVKRAKKEIIPECISFKKAVSQQVQAHQQFKIQLRYAQDKIEDIGTLIHKLFSLEFQFPKNNRNIHINPNWVRDERNMYTSLYMAKANLDSSNVRSSSCNARSVAGFPHQEKINIGQFTGIGQNHSGLVASSPQNCLVRNSSQPNTFANMPPVLSTKSSYMYSSNVDTENNQFQKNDCLILNQHSKQRIIASTKNLSSRIKTDSQYKPFLFERMGAQNKKLSWADQKIANSQSRMMKTSGLRLSHTFNQNRPNK